MFAQTPAVVIHCLSAWFSHFTSLFFFILDIFFPSFHSPPLTTAFLIRESWRCMQTAKSSVYERFESCMRGDKTALWKKWEIFNWVSKFSFLLSRFPFYCDSGHGLFGALDNRKAYPESWWVDYWIIFLLHSSFLFFPLFFAVWWMEWKFFVLYKSSLQCCHARILKAFHGSFLWVYGTFRGREHWQPAVERCEEDEEGQRSRKWI